MARRGRSQTRKVRLLLGIGIDEGVRFGLVELVNTDVMAVPSIVEAPFAGTPTAQAIEDIIGDMCAGLTTEQQRRIAGVSFSCIGNIDTLHQGAMNIIRPGWSKEQQDRHIDLGGMIGRCLPDEFPVNSDLAAFKVGHTPVREIYVTNDATCAAMGEYLTSHADLIAELRSEKHRRAQQVFAYIRVGAGVNIGLVINGFPWRGQLHPEFGHIRPRAYETRHGQRGYPWRDEFAGVCDAHGPCYEGLLCRKALEMRNQEDVPLSDLMAHYLAQMCLLVTMTLAPVRIVIGGSGVSGRSELLAAVREHFSALGQDYPIYGAMRNLDDYISEARCGGYANVLGALAIGRRELERPREARGRR